MYNQHQHTPTVNQDQRRTGDSQMLSARNVCNNLLLIRTVLTIPTHISSLSRGGKLMNVFNQVRCSTHRKPLAVPLATLHCPPSEVYASMTFPHPSWSRCPAQRHRYQPFLTPPLLMPWPMLLVPPARFSTRQNPGDVNGNLPTSMHIFFPIHPTFPIGILPPSHAPPRNSADHTLLIPAHVPNMFFYLPLILQLRRGAPVRQTQAQHKYRPDNPGQHQPRAITTHCNPIPSTAFAFSVYHRARQRPSQDLGIAGTILSYLRKSLNAFDFVTTHVC